MKENFHVWMQSAQEIGNSLQNQLEKTTDQAQSSITAITANTSGVIETAFNSYVNDFITRYPIFLKAITTLTWAINHPVMSTIILLLIIAFIWSIIKGIVRLIETASWSIFKVPLKLLKALFLTGLKKLILLIPLPKFNFRGLWKFTKHQDQEIQNANFTNISVNDISSQDKQKRLLAINNRLELIHQEQQQLLKEAAHLINSDRKNLITDK